MLPTPASPLPKQGSATKTLLAIVAILTALCLGLLTLLMLGFSTGPVGMLVGIVLAVVPVPVYMLLALWIDRFEKEPVWMLAAAFTWGATAAVFFAFILNTSFGMVASGVLGAKGEVATAVISAPFVEELAKGLALVVFFLWKRDEFDNVLDGIIYAAMTGLGFAMTENIMYYGNSVATGGLGASVFTFILRGVVSPFAHPLFTSMTGIGLGFARQAPKGSPWKFIAPILGIVLAMFLHFLWNFSASLGAMFFVAYAVVMVPLFLGLITIALLSLRKEGRIIRQFLLPERQSGFLDELGYQALGSVRGRCGESWAAFTQGGWRRWRRRTQFQELASELAFHRWRTGRGILSRTESSAAREAAYLTRLNALRIELGGMHDPRFNPSIQTASTPLTASSTRTAGGFTGVAIALSALGCLGSLTLGVIILAILLFAIGSTVENSNADGVVFKQPLATLMSTAACGAHLENTGNLDADTVRMFGAVDALSGNYARGLNLLLLNYRSPALAAAAVAPVRAATLMENAGWQQEETKAASQRVLLHQKSTGRSAVVATQGSLLMIVEGARATVEDCQTDIAAEIAGAAKPNG